MSFPRFPPYPVDFSFLGARLHPRNPQPSPLVLVLDLHGVLVQRLRNRDKEEVALSIAHRPPWRRFKKQIVWLRPHLRFFLNVATARHRVAVWSAAKRQNIEPLLDALSLDLGLRQPLSESLATLQDRSICRPDRASGLYEVVKYLPDFIERFPWSSAHIGNTVMVDDTVSKVRFNLPSAIVLPEYKASVMGDFYNDDDTLLWLLLYLEYLIVMSGLEADGPGVPAVRDSLMPFQDFCQHGFAVASQHATDSEKSQLASPAMYFFPDLSEYMGDNAREVAVAGATVAAISGSQDDGNDEPRRHGANGSSDGPHNDGEC